MPWPMFQMLKFYLASARCSAQKCACALGLTLSQYLSGMSHVRRSHVSLLSPYARAFHFIQLHFQNSQAFARARHVRCMCARPASPLAVALCTLSIITCTRSIF